MSKITVPKSIKNVASDLERLVVANYPHIMVIDDLPIQWQVDIQNRTDHELWYQDSNRYMSDIYVRETRKRG